MSDTNGAVFQELIGVEFDSQQFAQSLDQLISVYEQKMQEMSAKGVSAKDVINLAGVTELQSQLSDVTNMVKALGDAFIESFTALSGATQQAVDSQTNIKRAIQDTDDAAEKHSSKMEELAAKDFAFQSEQFDKAALKQYETVQKAERDYELSQINKAKAAEQASAKLEQLAAKDAAFQSEQLDKASAKLAQLAAKDAAFQSEQLDKVAAKQYELVSKAERDYELSQIKKSEADKVAASEADAAQIRVNESFIALMQKRDVDLASLRGKRLSEDISAAEKANQDQIRLNQQFIDIMQKRDVELAAMRGKQLADADKVAAKQAQQSKGFTGGFGSGFSGGEELSGFNIGEMVGQVTRFQLLWGGIGLAMEAAMAPLRAIVNGFKEGFDYLNELEQKSYELTGVLDANVKFSNDLKQNFQDASLAAPEVVKALQDVAAATGLKPDNLIRSFSALTESGGVGAVNNLQELVKLTELFNLAMRGAGASVETSRLLISQMPNAMSGNISATSKWLEVLHMGPQEWNLMVKSGLEHHDLLQRLQSAMQPYLDATAQAALNEQELSDKVDILKKRLEATFVAPYQDIYKKFLTDVVDLLGDMDDKAASINKRIAEATNANMSAKHPWMTLLLAAAGVGGPVGDTPFASETNQFSEGPQFDAQMSAYADDLMKRNVSAKHGPGGKPNDDALNALKEHYGTELRTIRDSAQTQLSSIDELEKAHTISVKDATDARIAVYQEEKKQIDALVVAIRNQLAVVGGTNKSRGAFGSSLTNEGIGIDSQTNININKANGQLESEENRTTQTRLNGEMQLAQKTAQFEIEQAKLSGANHVQIVDLEIAADQKKFDKEQEIIAAEREAANSNEQALQEVANKQQTLDAQVAQSAVTNSQKRNNAIIADLTHEVDEASKAAMSQVHTDEARLQADKQKGVSSDALKTKAHALSVEYQNALATEQRNIQIIIALAQAMGMQGEAVDKLKDKLQALNAEKQKAVNNDPNNQPTPSDPNNPWKIGDNGSQLNRDLKDFGKLWNDGVHDWGDGVKLMNKGFDLFKDGVSAFMSAWKQGSAQGGTLGGIGGVLGQAGGIIGSIPGGELAGGIIQGAGAVFGIIGGLFTSAAKHIADDIKKEFDKTIQNLQNGTIGLNDAIQQVEKQRNDAIAQLSSKKGGKDQLNQLLPQLDNELASLKQQQKSILDNFEQQLAQLQTGSTVLGNVLKTWTDINKQVKDYIAAGGDAVKAQQLLNLTLQQMQKDAQGALDQGNQTAIQDALNLNSLLTQRINLQKQFAATMFGLQTQDSLERRGSNAITVGTQAQQQLKDFQTQMADLDNQISLGKQKVALEGQVFNINQSIADLQKSSNALTIKALQDQLAILKDQAKVVAGIYTAGGNTSFTSGFAAAIGAGASSAPGSMPITINIDTGGAPVDASGIADQLTSELSRRGRYGLGANLVRQY